MKKKSNKELDDELTKLSWKLIEWRVAYYRPEIVKNLDKYEIPDGEYDQHERRYKELCSLLGKKPYTTTMIEVDKDRPSVQLVMSKLSEKE